MIHEEQLKIIQDLMLKYREAKEEYIFEAIKVLRSFYSTLTEPMLTKDPQVQADSSPDPELYNELWQQLMDDLIIIFTELENIESLTLNNFNYIPNNCSS